MRGQVVPCYRGGVEVNGTLSAQEHAVKRQKLSNMLGASLRRHTCHTELLAADVAGWRRSR